MAKTGASKKEISDYAQIMYDSSNYAFPVENTLSELRQVYKWSDTCQNTVPVAIRCFLDSEDYESCIRNCLGLPCDMDTMCCIAGGIAEAYYGKTGLNNEDVLRRYLDDELYSEIQNLL